ncbi:hypothetical protein SAMN05428964_108154 [Thalassospira xiamenensis]|uniref:Uncharacterized protein n=1 Tax=Thalassospira xiamenensis TaxID=220697 RepID=A0A285TXF8_9PROT|nr:hypothetical protein SAMN05428964_108154 [Thalassospira xiamenensis]
MDDASETKKRLKWPFWIVVLIVAGLGVLIGANAHMVYVSVVSQPDCVAHTKQPGKLPGQYRAAKSAC